MIRDNPTFQDLRNISESFPYIWKLRPLLPLFGRAGRELLEALEQFRPELMLELRDALDVPDQFNAVFGPRGWVAYLGLGADVMRHALSLTDSGEIAEAEQFLAGYYSREVLEGNLDAACESSEAFRRRERLLRLAIEDHLAGRYHASVHLVLSHIDGIAIDLTGRPFYHRQDFYAKYPEHMAAADTVAGHPTGLRVLAAVMGAYRRETTTTPLDTPYRHGVDHGRDLAYDTEIASAKAFAALFALAEWAGKAEKGELDRLVPPAWPDLNSLTPSDLWRELKALYHALKQLYFRKRTGRSFQRTSPMRESYADRIYMRYGIEPPDVSPGNE
ncbi:MAG: hypothetical protein M3P51_12485 [Chloroflexota bacterium]|nr:hypothetical protein [Chloroflexota bacterium]